MNPAPQLPVIRLKRPLYLWISWTFPNSIFQNSINYCRKITRTNQGAHSRIFKRISFGRRPFYLPVSLSGPLDFSEASDKAVEPDLFEISLDLPEIKDGQDEPSSDLETPDLIETEDSESSLRQNR